MALERDDLQSPGIEQSHVRDVRAVVGIDEDLEIGFEVEAVLMEETGVQGVVAGHALDQGGVEGDLLFGLRDIDETHSGKAGNLLGRAGGVGASELRGQHFGI